MDTDSSKAKSRLYFIDEDQLKLLKQIEKFLYGNTAFLPGFLDKKRDMANLINLVLNNIEKDQELHGIW
jgi:hypothetical protein